MTISPRESIASRNESNDLAATAERLALGRCLLVMDAFRAIRRIMPLQEAYAFLLVASEEGCDVSEYAKRAGVTQAVMTRILFALSSRGRQRDAGYGLVQQAADPQDLRRVQTFLTSRGKALMREIVRSLSGRQHETKLRPIAAETSQEGLEHHQWLSKLIAAGRKLAADDVQLVVSQAEALIGHRRSSRKPLRRQPRV